MTSDDILQPVAPKPETQKQVVNLSRSQFSKGEHFRPSAQRLIDGGIRYASRWELATSRMLQKYTEGKWQPEIGRTFQVRIGFSAVADFHLEPIKDVILEIHPIVWRHQMRSTQARDVLASRWSRLSFRDREAIDEVLYLELRKDYFDRRRFAMDYGDLRDKYSNTELILCCSGEEVVKRVFVPLGIKRVEALAEWKRLINSKHI